MHSEKFIAPIAGLSVLIALTACSQRLPEEAPRHLVPPKTVVVADFQGGRLGAADEDSRFWSKALASLLIGDLRASDNLKVIDRSQLDNVLREQALSVTDLADPSTRLRLGRLLGADLFIFGTYTIIGDVSSLTARITDVETGRVLKAEHVSGPSKDMRFVSRSLSIQLLKRLDAKLARQQLSELERLGGTPVEAVRYFSQGLDYELQGKYDDAVAMYTRALEIDPTYLEARQHLESASEKSVR